MKGISLSEIFEELIPCIKDILERYNLDANEYLSNAYIALDKVYSRDSFLKNGSFVLWGFLKELESINNIYSDETSVESVPIENANLQCGDPFDVAVEAIMKDAVVKYVATLQPRKALILTKRFGLNGEKQMSIQEVAEMLNISEARAQQIERKTISEMSRQLYTHRELRAEMNYL